MKMIIPLVVCGHCDIRFLVVPWLPHRVAGYCERCAPYCVPHLTGKKGRRRRNGYL